VLQKITIQLGSGWVFVGFLPGFSGGFTPKPLDYLGRPMCPGIQTLFVVQLITYDDNDCDDYYNYNYRFTAVSQVNLH